MYTTTSSFLFTLLAGSAGLVSARPTPAFSPPVVKIIPVANVKNPFAFPVAAAKIAARAATNPKLKEASISGALPIAVKAVKKSAKSSTVKRAIASASATPSVLQQMHNLFDPRNQYFPATVAVTAIAGFLLCLGLIWIIQRIAHLKRFADEDVEPYSTEFTEKSSPRYGRGTGPIPIYAQPTVPELRVLPSPDVSPENEKKRWSRELLAPPGYMYNLPEYAEEEEEEVVKKAPSSAHVGRPPRAVAKEQRRNQIIAPQAYRMAGVRSGSRRARRSQQAGLGVGGPQGRRTFARVVTQ